MTTHATVSLSSTRRSSPVCLLHGWAGRGQRPVRRGCQTPQGRGRSAARYQRATEETAERNIKEAVDESVHFFTERDCRRVILAGTDANVAQFRGQLPKIWQDRVVGTFSVDANANAAQIGELALGSRSRSRANARPCCSNKSSPPPPRAAPP
ncbi:MAG: hypothetical protein HZY76_04065 [Anaerolineae bacterium]|nr:MAG: hypothetical protein HZY76_04065 [Anaerolineae bacterium]